MGSNAVPVKDHGHNGNLSRLIVVRLKMLNTGRKHETGHDAMTNEATVKHDDAGCHE